ncbi:MAG TPA: hypothetical protein VE242_03145 [Chthoniobacterales bacterium]|nr:hypothetical protein [Chthoniobacterales bacterium]
MSCQKPDELLTQLYLELGLPLPDAYRAAAADLKDNPPPSDLGNEISSYPVAEDHRLSANFLRSARGSDAGANPCSWAFAPTISL